MEKKGENKRSKAKVFELPSRDDVESLRLKEAIESLTTDEKLAFHQETLKAHAEMINHIYEQIEIAQQNFDAVEERIGNLEHFCFVLASQMLSHIKGKPLGNEELKELASMLSYNLNEGIENLFTAGLFGFQTGGEKNEENSKAKALRGQSK